MSAGRMVEYMCGGEFCYKNASEAGNILEDVNGKTYEWDIIRTLLVFVL